MSLYGSETHIYLPTLDDSAFLYCGRPARGTLHTTYSRLTYLLLAYVTFFFSADLDGCTDGFSFFLFLLMGTVYSSANEMES